MVDVYQFGVLFRISGFNHIDQGTGGIHAGEARDGQLHRPLVHGSVIAQCRIVGLSGKDDIAGLSAFHQIDDIRALLSLLNLSNLDTHGADGFCRASCGIKLHSQGVQFHGNRQDFRIIPFLNGNHHAVLLSVFSRRHGKSGGGQSLEQGFIHGPTQSQNFSRGLHFRSQDGVGIGELLKGEYRNLYGHVGRSAVQSRSVSQIFQLRPQHYLGRQIHHRYTGYLTDVRYRPGCSRIHLDDVQLSVVLEILDIDQALGTQRQRQFLGNIHNSSQLTIRQIERRIYSDRVTGVNSGFLDMLHDSRNQHILSVGNNIHFQLNARHVFVHQHRVVVGVFQNSFHVLSGILFVPGNGHVLAADDVGRSQKHRIADFFCRPKCALQVGDTLTLRTADAEFFQKSVELTSVFRQIDSFCRGAQNLNSVVVQELGELDGGLTTEGHNDADRLLHLDDVHHVFRMERLEIQTVRRVVVRGYGFRVVVDNHYVVAHLPQRPYAVYR